MLLRIKPTGFIRSSPKPSISFYDRLVDTCVASKSPLFAKAIHAHLLKFGFLGLGHTFLGNRCLDLYVNMGHYDDVLKAFDDIGSRNLVSWNVFLKGWVRFGRFEDARKVFDDMPRRDVVSWNSMLSGCVLHGFHSDGLELFRCMMNEGVRPSQYTYSILTSLVSCVQHGKEVHGGMIRNLWHVQNVVLGNSLLDLYGKLGLVNYAYALFLTMGRIDIVSWNSLILGFSSSGYSQQAMDLFGFLLQTGWSPDEFTVSIGIATCGDLCDLGMGKKLFALCYKLGFLRNAIVSSAVIDLFSKCNRLEDSVQFFEEMDDWHVASSNSMISSFVSHGYFEVALLVFSVTLSKGIRPTDFTFSSIVSAVTFVLVDQGTELHSMVIKSGFELDTVIACSLMEMYIRVGLVSSALEIFLGMVARDLISWNCMIVGFSQNGRVIEAINFFQDMLLAGQKPDRVTLYGVLQACNFGGFVDEGLNIFRSMEGKYGVVPGGEHYSCVLNLLHRVGRLEEMASLVEEIPCRLESDAWGTILSSCVCHGNLELLMDIETRLIEIEVQSLRPLVSLAKAYETHNRWESVVRIRNAMTEKGGVKVIGCSWIGIRNHVFTFSADQLEIHRGGDIFMVLSLLNFEMKDEDCMNVVWQCEMQGGKTLV